MAGIFLNTSASRFVSQKLNISIEFGTRALDLVACSASKLFCQVPTASIAMSCTKITICLAERIISSLYYVNDWKMDQGHMKLHAVCSETTMQLLPYTHIQALPVN